MVRRALIFLLLLSSGMCGARTKAVTVTRIYSASFCSPCHKLQEQFLRDGKALLIVPVSGDPGVPQYPWFSYSDNTQDDGSKYRSGGAALVAPVKFVEVVQ